MASFLLRRWQKDLPPESFCQPTLPGASRWKLGNLLVSSRIFRRQRARSFHRRSRSNRQIRKWPVEPAWERRKQLGAFSALVETVRQVLATPVATFKAMKREGGQATPLFFYLLVTTFATWAAIAYQLTFIMMNPEAILGPLAKSLDSASIIGIHVFLMALFPMLLILVAYCAAGIFHLVFQLLGSSSQPFEVTFRAYCYAVAPASVFRLIPICGDVLFFIAALVLLVFSFRETLRVDGARATIGVMLPSLLCCGFIWAAYTLAGGAVAQGVLK